MNNFRQSSGLTGSQSTSSTLKQKKSGRLYRFYESVWARLAMFYRFGRKFLWVGSTCTSEIYSVLILIFLPMAFGYMSEIQEEMMKMSAPGSSTHSLIQSRPPDLMIMPAPTTYHLFHCSIDIYHTFILCVFSECRYSIMHARS